MIRNILIAIAAVPFVVSCAKQGVNASVKDNGTQGGLAAHPFFAAPNKIYSAEKLDVVFADVATPQARAIQEDFRFSQDWRNLELLKPYHDAGILVGSLFRHNPQSSDVRWTTNWLTAVIPCKSLATCGQEVAQKVATVGGTIHTNFDLSSVVDRNAAGFVAAVKINLGTDPRVTERFSKALSDLAAKGHKYSEMFGHRSESSFFTLLGQYPLVLDAQQRKGSFLFLTSPGTFSELPCSAHLAPNREGRPYDTSFQAVEVAGAKCLPLL